MGNVPLDQLMALPTGMPQLLPHLRGRSQESEAVPEEPAPEEPCPAPVPPCPASVPVQPEPLHPELALTLSDLQETCPAGPGL